jgi:hypothetical protein
MVWKLKNQRTKGLQFAYAANRPSSIHLLACTTLASTLRNRKVSGRSGNGTGLRLSLVKAISKLHKATLKLKMRCLSLAPPLPSTP